MLTEKQRRADDLMREWLGEWMADEADASGAGRYYHDHDWDRFIEMAVENASRGWSPSDVGEDAYEDVYARHHGDAPDSVRGGVDEELEDRVMTYFEMSPRELETALRLAEVEAVIPAG